MTPLRHQLLHASWLMSMVANALAQNTIIMASSSTTSSSSTSVIPPTTAPNVNTNGWNGNGNNIKSNQESWLRQHNRFVFVIVLGVLFLALLIWYIVRSIKAMQRRLKHDNQAQLEMLGQSRLTKPDEIREPLPAYKAEPSLHLTSFPPPTSTQY